MRSLVRFALVISVASALLASAMWALSVPYKEVTSDLWLAKATKLGELTELSQPSVVYDRNGAFLTLLKAEENRKPVELSAVPPVIVQAILDVEDESFYDHDGFDLKSTARAALSNADAGSIRQGGSTITQQLVKKTLLNDERSVDRKLKEAVLATRLEKELTKEQILERYLNLVYFGNGAYGVGAATETYFNIPLAQVGPGQSALLAGLIRNPLANDPFRNPEQAKARRATALSQMVGNGHLSPEEAERLKAEALPAAPNKPQERQSYFLEAMKQRLLDDPRLGETAPERYDLLFRGGLQIHTTFDPRAQQLAEEATRAGIPPPGRSNPMGAVSALVSLDPVGGGVRAVVGGPGFSEQNKFDIATQGYRQPGSTFKLFTLLAALEAGYGADSTVDASGPCIANVGRSRSRRGTSQDNVINNAGDGVGGGTMTMAAATAGSVNCAFERMAATIGFNKVIDMAKRLGLGQNPLFPIEDVATMPIGVEEATPLEMAAAYATVANDGVYHPPTFFDRVDDRRGKTVFKGTVEGKRVMSQAVARTAADIQRGVFGGTATCCRLRDNRPAAGKTGTTDGSKNTWFAGYTPNLTTVVWVGVPGANVSTRGLGGRGAVYGATFAAPIWKKFMDNYLAGQPAPNFQGIPPKQAIGNRAFVLPANARILGGSGGATAQTKKGSRDRQTDRTQTTKRRSNTRSSGSRP
ncbi:MAG: transglycosylase domain-containing protein [Acidimicrobiales bacterium]